MSVEHPMRAEARAASHPAWPAPMTMTSYFLLIDMNQPQSVLPQDAEKKDYHVIASDRRERGNLNKNHARLLRR
jgi:hypothetical protein